MHARNTKKQHSKLQWGRPFYRAERRRFEQAVFAYVTNASMGPPFLRGGELDSLAKQITTSISFNGAALFIGRRAKILGLFQRTLIGFNGAALFIGRRAGPTFPQLGGEVGVGFNGAALFIGRRVLSYQGAKNIGDKLLQWGRPFYRAERQGELPPRGGTIPSRASMGPPFLRGGERDTSLCGQSTRIQPGASMGPPFLRGGEI